MIGSHVVSGRICARRSYVSGGIHLKEYLASTEDVLKEQSTNAETGLTSAEAQKREAKYGPNKLKEEEKTPLWIRFFQQMADPMVIMLIVAAVISAVTGMIQGESEWADVIIIMAVVIINSALASSRRPRARRRSLPCRR